MSVLGSPLLLLGVLIWFDTVQAKSGLCPEARRECMVIARCHPT